MRQLIALLGIISLAQLASAQEGSGAVCRVTVLGNAAGRPDDQRDGLLLLRVFVSTSTSCRSGEVEVAVFPTSVCMKRPQTDIDDATPMTFTYKPAVAKLQVEPGNINSAVFAISSGNAGKCTFNSHIVSCGAVTPTGGRCKTRSLTDPQPEQQLQGGIEREFNRLR